jgi:hypothetical protein
VGWWEVTVLPVFDTGQNLPLARPVAFQPIGDDALWNVPAALLRSRRQPLTDSQTPWLMISAGKPWGLSRLVDGVLMRRASHTRQELDHRLHQWTTPV